MYPPGPIKRPKVPQALDAVIPVGDDKDGESFCCFEVLKNVVHGPFCLASRDKPDCTHGVRSVAPVRKRVHGPFSPISEDPSFQLVVVLKEEVVAGGIVQVTE